MFRSLILTTVVGGGLLAVIALPKTWSAARSSKAVSTLAPTDPTTAQVHVSGGTFHDFGTLARHETAERVFEIRNEGESELTLRLSRTSCGCTRVRLDGADMESPILAESLPPLPAAESIEGDLVPIAANAQFPEHREFRLAPGKSALLEMTWTTGENLGQYRQSAQIATNDPRWGVLEFVVQGKVRAKSG